MTDESNPVAHLSLAITTTQKLIAKAQRALDPLDREMRVMKWNPEYQVIMWEAVMLEAKLRMEKAKP